MKRWTAEEVALLVQWYPFTPMPELEIKVGRTAGQIKNKARVLGLKRDMSLVEATRFKPGIRGDSSHNWIPPGERRDHGPYTRVKLPDGKWMFEHKWVWEQANGPVPEGMVVAAKDGNVRNTELSNLCLRTRAEHQLRNSHYYKDLPGEIVDVIFLQKELTKEITRRTSNEK